MREVEETLLLLLLSFRSKLFILSTKIRRVKDKRIHLLRVRSMITKGNGKYKIRSENMLNMRKKYKVTNEITK